VDGPPEGEGADPEAREKVREKALGMGNEAAYAWLRELDPGSAERIHANDRKRVLRAIEKAGGPTTHRDAGYRPLGRETVRFLGLERSRASLDVRLTARTHSMWREGLLRESEALRSKGLAADHPVWGAIGYTEALAFLEGALTEGEAKERIFRRTRQYAKRQGTWFRRQHEVEWTDLERFSDAEKTAEHLRALIKG
jgi:tRNA dimethylallyltransferase